MATSELAIKGLLFEASFSQIMWDEGKVALVADLKWWYSLLSSTIILYAFLQFYKALGLRSKRNISFHLCIFISYSFVSNFYPSLTSTGLQFSTTVSSSAIVEQHLHQIKLALTSHYSYLYPYELAYLCYLHLTLFITLPLYDLPLLLTLTFTVIISWFTFGT